MRLVEAAEPIRAALTRLAEAPHALRCFVVIREPLTGRFVQFYTPPPPSKFTGSPRIRTSEPLILDGTGNSRDDGFEPITEPCGVDRGVDLALDILAKHLPVEAELQIIEESTRSERPS